MHPCTEALNVTIHQTEKTDPKPVFFFSFFLWFVVLFCLFSHCMTKLENYELYKQSHSLGIFIPDLSEQWDKKFLQIPFPFWNPLLLLLRRLSLLSGEFFHPLQVAELENGFFWWFGFSGHAELVMHWRLTAILWYMCICSTRVTEERQALLARVSEVNLEFLDQRSVWLYIGNVF